MGRRKVSLEIDSGKFSKAFPTLSGQEAKEILVMMVCGGHAVQSHGQCLRDIGIYPASPCGEPSARQAETNAKIAVAADAFLDEVGQVRPSAVFDALADRPRKGSKSLARDTFRRLLGAVHEMRRSVEWAEPKTLVASDAEADYQNRQPGS